jgi:hypothetical protein
VCDGREHLSANDSSGDLDPAGGKLARMNDRFERRELQDPWQGRQPKGEKLVMRGPRQFVLAARLPSGEGVDVPLGRLTFDMRLDPPRRQPKYDNLVMRGPRRFALAGRLPSGERVDVPLGRFTFELRLDPPQR